MGRVLVSPFAWGLGHAMRDIPIIEEFLRRGHEVHFAADGRAKLFLEERYPDLKMHHLPDITVRFPKTKYFVAALLSGLPKMWSGMWREAHLSRKLIASEKFDMTFSDQRYNVRHPSVPSVLYNHQLRFMGPSWLRWFEYVLEAYNAPFFNRFDHLVVPDYHGFPNLSGRLSHNQWLVDKEKVFFAGPIADVQKKTVKQDVDLFISVSGPEPQRSVFERIVLKQLPKLEGKVVVTLGRPKTKVQSIWNAEVHPFLDRDQQLEMMQRAKMMVCRSGYTTMMELAELGKNALLVPTVGQTEQVYLSNYYSKQGWFHSVGQGELNLSADIERARKFKGFPKQHDSRENVKALYDKLFSKYLD